MPALWPQIGVHEVAAEIVGVWAEDFENAVKKRSGMKLCAIPCNLLVT